LKAKRTEFKNPFAQETTQVNPIITHKPGTLLTMSSNKTPISENRPTTVEL